MVLPLPLAAVYPEMQFHHLLLTHDPLETCHIPAVCMQHRLVFDADPVPAPHTAGLSRAPSAAIRRQLGPATMTHQMHLGMHGDQHSPTCYRLIDHLGPLPSCSKAAHQVRASPVWCYRLQDMRPALPNKIGSSCRCHLMVQVKRTE